MRPETSEESSLLDKGVLPYTRIKHSPFAQYVDLITIKLVAEDKKRMGDFLSGISIEKVEALK